MNSNKLIGIRVHVDFEISIRKGVPYLLDVFRQNNITASFHVTMGADPFMRNTRDLGTRKFIERALFHNFLKMVWGFGFPYLTRQLLGFPKNVGQDHPEILTQIIKEGHEVGIHAYDHYWWVNNIWKAPMEQIKEDMEKALYSFRKATGCDAKVFAAPSWMCSKDSLMLIDEYNFAYGADCRGESAFYPVIDGYKGTRVQLPVTLPFLQEIKQPCKTNDDAVINEVLSLLNDRLNVLCIHGYYEGILERELFKKLVSALKKKGFSFVPMQELFSSLKKEEIPTCEIIRKKISLGKERISFQGKKVF